MIVEGDTEIEADGRGVWEFLLDPRRVASCVPGIEDVQQLDERTFQGVISAAVGPLNGRFAFRTVVTRADFPADLVVHVEGTDSVTRSTVRARLSMGLDEFAPGRTRLRYHATVDTDGRLAILGDMILRATANLVFAQFARCLRVRFAGAAGAEPAA